MDNYKNKTVLVTGCSGFIGSNLIYKLMNIKNIKIIALGRNEKKIKDCFSIFLKKKNFKYIVHDISLPINFIKERIDYIFHCASPQEKFKILNYPVDVIRPNLFGVINCLEFLKYQKKKIKTNGRFVLFSSIAIYAHKSKVDVFLNEKQTNNSDFIDSDYSPYSQSKRASEVIVNSYVKQHKLNAVICRLSTVYGYAKNYTNTAFFDFVKKAIQRKNINIKDTNFFRRDNIYISDAINGINIVATKGLKGEAYNISSGGEKDNFKSVAEIAKIIADESNKLFKKKIKVNFGKSKKKIKLRLPGIILDNSKLKKLKWNLKIKFKIGIFFTIKNFIKFKA